MATHPSPDLGQERKAPHPPAFIREPGSNDRDDFHRSRFPGWLAILALSLGLAGSGWYFQTRLGGHDATLGQLMEDVKNWPNAIASVKQQVTNIEQTLASLPKQIVAMNDKLAGLDRRIDTGLDRAQKSSRDLGASLRNEIASVRQDVRDASSAQEKNLEARIRELDTARRVEAARTEQLEQQVAQLNERLTGVGRELENARNSAQQDSQQVRQEIRATSSRVAQVATYGNRRRERFEASRGRTVEIAPGMLLHITRSDPRYRRFDGWLQLVNDSGRFLWLRDQSMLQPVAFYAGSNALRHDLLVTDLNRGGVTGYVIFPQQGELQGTELLSRAGARAE